MPYCWKCGAKLEENAEYCHVCGTSVRTPSVPAGVPSRPRSRTGWTPVHTLAVVLGSILIVAMIASVFFLLPVQPVNFTRFEQVPSQLGVNAINLNLTADVAAFNITFRDLNGSAMTLNVSATGGVGASAPSEPLNVTVDSLRAGQAILVDARIARNGTWWPLFGGLKVMCDVQIERSLNVTLNVKTSAGSVALVASQGVVFESLGLEATTGRADATIGRGVVVDGTVVVQSTTGGSSLNWDDVKVNGNVSVNVRTTTGGVGVNITQNSVMAGNVTLNAGAVTGGVDFSTTIHDSVGMEVNSSTTVGGVNTNLTRFSGSESHLQSDNYAAPSNFIVTLSTMTGGISIRADYEPGQHM
jgi:hypothetical protein